MNARRLVAVLALVLAGCAPVAAAPPAPVVLAGSVSGLVNLPAGRYRFDWQTTCTSFFVQWAPTSGAPVVDVPVPDPARGSGVVDLAGGKAYVNRGGICPNGGDYTVTVIPAS